MKERMDLTSLPPRERIQKVLLFRSGRMWQVCSAVDSLREKYPCARIDVLCQQGSADECAALSDVDQVIHYPGDRFSIANTPPGLFWKINRTRYDLIAVVINDKSGLGYSRIFNMLLLFGAPFKMKYCPFTHKWIRTPVFMPGPTARILLSPVVAVLAAALTIVDIFRFTNRNI